MNKLPAVDPIQVQIAVIATDVSYIKKSVSTIEDQLREDYSTKEELDAVGRALIERVKPIERIVYGMIGLILMSVIAALLALVLHKP